MSNKDKDFINKVCQMAKLDNISKGTIVDSIYNYINHNGFKYKLPEIEMVVNSYW